MSNRAVKNKYQTIVTTREEMDAQAAEMEMEMNMKENNEEEVDISNVKKADDITVDDITKSMNKQMKISKKKSGQDQTMVPTKTITKADKLA